MILPFPKFKYVDSTKFASSIFIHYVLWYAFIYASTTLRGRWDDRIQVQTDLLVQVITLPSFTGTEGCRTPPSPLCGLFPARPCVQILGCLRLISCHADVAIVINLKTTCATAFSLPAYRYMHKHAYTLTHTNTYTQVQGTRGCVQSQKFCKDFDRMYLQVLEILSPTFKLIFYLLTSSSFSLLPPEPSITAVQY